MKIPKGPAFAARRKKNHAEGETDEQVDRLKKTFIWGEKKGVSVSNAVSKPPGGVKDAKTVVTNFGQEGRNKRKKESTENDNTDNRHNNCFVTQEGRLTKQNEQIRE